MCFCGCSKTATLEQLSPTTTTTQSQIQCCLQDRMRQSPKQIQILDDQKTSTFKTIREEEAGNSKSMYRTSGSKDIVILYVGNPDTQAQTQTEAVMKVNCVIYLYNVWPSIRSIPHLGLVNTHLSQICQKVLFLFFFLSEVFRPEMSLTPHATHPDKPARYPERFQEPMHTPDYRPAPEEFAGTRSSAPPLHMERGPSMDRSTRYSRNLDKITSTLLELVSRK